MKTIIIIAALAMALFTVASVNAQKKKHADSKHEKMVKSIYTCPMHPEVKSDKPGKCPKCGMKLTKKEMKHDKMAKVYTCPMHPEIKSDKPGKCPKCGMKLTKKEMKHDKMAKVYTCPMHPKVKKDKPGDCPKCGMKLVQKKMKKKEMKGHEGHNH